MHRFKEILAHGASAVTANKDIPLAPIVSQLRAFQRGIDEARTLTLSPQTVALKRLFAVFAHKTDFFH